MKLQRIFAAAALALVLGGCSAGGSMLPPVSGTTVATSATGTRATAGSAVATEAMGAMALPGMGAMALPGMGALALPGMGAMALPGMGALALPGIGALALPGTANVNALLAILAHALPVCAVGGIVHGAAQCNALFNTQIPVITNPYTPAALISGLHPSDLQAAYRYSGSGAGQTVAVIDAGHDPTAASDLAVYRSAFGLGDCTAISGCFRQVNQSGTADTFPAVISGWAQETGVDVDMVSAVCPRCSILLVEANSAQISDLAAAVDTAVALGATVVSNSYYAPEYDGELDDEKHFNHPGVAMTVAAGDTGYGTTFPASSRYVTAVGGTTLTRGGPHGWSESVWSGTGSGCSAYVAKPVWQHDTGCAKRTVADVAVIGDPMTGVAAYNTTAASSQAGWGVYGGTSVGAPIVAALYALAGNASAVNGAANIYASSASFSAVLSGSNGSCSPAYLCTAGAGYNGPAGVGVPNGLAGF
jgi:hypothetical protein